MKKGQKAPPQKVLGGVSRRGELSEVWGATGVEVQGHKNGEPSRRCRGLLTGKEVQKEERGREIGHAESRVSWLG